MNWILQTEKPLSQDDGEVLGFHPEWVDEDFNPKGIRIGFLDADGRFCSARYWSYQDCYVHEPDFSDTCECGNKEAHEKNTQMPVKYLIPSNPS